MDWLSILPYNREIFHTSVLRFLLSPERGSAAVKTANLLLRSDDITAIQDSPLFERRMKARRAVDLGADLARSGNDPIRLGVETKVDSAWRRDQLDDSIEKHDKGILLLLGRTFLSLEERDMEKDHRNWVLVGPERFAEIVRLTGSADIDLQAYAKKLEREADAHRIARRLATGDLLIGELSIAERLLLDGYRDGSEADLEALHMWAYFREVLAERSPKWISHWEAKTLQGGPLLTLWGPQTGGRGTFIEFVGQAGRRYLRIKGHALAGDIRDHQRETLDQLGPHGEALGLSVQGAKTRVPPAASKTCTILSFELDDVTPREALIAAEEARSRLIELVG